MLPRNFPRLSSAECERDMNAARYQHSIASDFQRRALVRFAVAKGMEQARGDFFHALLVEGLDDESLSFFARAEWEAFSQRIQFDYPHFALALFLRAYQSAYRAHLLHLANGTHESPYDLIKAIEAETGLTSA